MGKHVKSFVAEVKKNRALFVMAMPAFLLVLIMQYLPMSGLVLAFKNYRYDLGVFGSEWNGFANFEYLFSSGTGWLITRNTVVYNLLNLVTSQLLAVLIAIFISEINKKIFKKVTQSIIFLPYFISWVIVGVFVYNIFNYETGILNSIVTFFGGEKINMYDASKAGIWPWIICLFNSWKWCGYNSVIYIAAITGVDAEIHEAASIDGANIFERIRFITLPSILPTIITMLLLQVGRILRGDFEMFYQIVGNNGQLFNKTDVIDTYVFRSLIQNSNLGMTAAASFYQSVICFATILIVNAIVKHPEYDIHYSNMVKDVAHLPYTQDCMVISNTSKNPERAMALWDLITNDQEVYDAFYYGIEGTSYELNDEGQFKILDTDNYGTSAMWSARSDALNRQQIGTPDDYKTNIDEFESHIVSGQGNEKFTGFVLDTSSFETQLAACNNVQQQYWWPLELGYTDAESGLADYQSQMEAAGIEAMKEAAQKQLDAYVASLK